MVAEREQKQPSPQVWLTLLAVGAVLLGGVAGWLTGEGSDAGFGGFRSGGWARGMAGAILGLIAGLGVLAFGRFAPRQTPGTHPAGGRGGGGTLPVQGDGPTVSSGQRLFAFLWWGLVGTLLIGGCGIAALTLFDRVYERLWPMPSLPEVDEWDRRYAGKYDSYGQPREEPQGDMVPDQGAVARVPVPPAPVRPDDSARLKWDHRRHRRTDFAGVLGGMVAGVVLLTCFSLMRERMIAGPKGVQPGGPAPPRPYPWCSTLSVLLGLAGMVLGALIVLASYNPVRGGGRPPGSCVFAWWALVAAGVLAAVIGNHRNERWRGLRLLGLVLNALLIGLGALAWMSE